MRLIYSDWGGHGPASHIHHALQLVDCQSTLHSVDGREELERVFAEAPPPPGGSVLLFSAGFVNQIGPEAVQLVPASAPGLRVLWLGVEPGPQHVGEAHTVAQGFAEDDGAGLSQVALTALGHDPSALTELLAAVDAVLRPRFDAAVFDGCELYCYDPELDLELHPDLLEARDHQRDGTLRAWLEEMLAEADAEM